MTFGGWIVMTLSVSGVTTLLAFCVWKVMTVPGESERVHGFEFETPDERNDRDPSR